MGRVLAPYGLRGWLKARAFTASPAGLLAYRVWWLAKEEGAWREFAVREARAHADALVAELEGLGTREQAARWRGATIAVPRAALPPLGRGEVYLADLVGLAVVNRAGVTLGRVTGVLETAAHPVLRIAREGNNPGERLIPLVPAHVDAIELDRARILVDWALDY
ncbi:MAG TPA: ribosome maturation factor RimM [Casimicrobiaceae bacterium]